MALKTTLEQLEEVQEAITAVMGGQGYTIDGVTFTRPMLSSLQEREEYILKRYNQDTAKTKPRVSTINFTGGFE